MGNNPLHLSSGVTLKVGRKFLLRKYAKINISVQIWAINLIFRKKKYKRKPFKKWTKFVWAVVWDINE